MVSLAWEKALSITSLMLAYGVLLAVFSDCVSCSLLCIIGNTIGVVSPHPTGSDCIGVVSPQTAGIFFAGVVSPQVVGSSLMGVVLPQDVGCSWWGVVFPHTVG